MATNIRLLQVFKHLSEIFRGFIENSARERKRYEILVNNLSVELCWCRGSTFQCKYLNLKLLKGKRNAGLYSISA